MAGAPIPFRQILENRFSQLAAETEMLFADARERARTELSDQLNQAARRMFQTETVEELAFTLAAAAAPFASTALVFRIEGDRARSSRIDLPLSSAAAFSDAIQSRDPVIAATTPGEVSGELMDLLGHSGEDRAHIYPLPVAGAVPALLYASGAVQGAALELLSQVGAAAWAKFTPPPASVPSIDVIRIQPLPVQAAPAPASSWDRLPPGEQQIHLRAQRWARVRVAEMRLREATAVQSARTSRNLYQTLRDPIDGARAEFHQTFFSACPSMVDYLHLELLRTLAHDDADLLGQDYPGPLV